MIERSMMIHHHIEARDPGEAVRKAMGANGGAEGFARVLGEQGAFGSPDARLPRAGALVTPRPWALVEFSAGRWGKRPLRSLPWAALTRNGAGAPDSVPSRIPILSTRGNAGKFRHSLEENSRISLGGGGPASERKRKERRNFPVRCFDRHPSAQKPGRHRTG